MEVSLVLILLAAVALTRTVSGTTTAPLCDDIDHHALAAVTVTGTVSATTTAPLCDDIDHHACELMHSTRPDLCNDTALAMSACRRFCNLCPIECYHCTGSVTDYRDCNTTKLCAVGEACMIKQLDATSDGHREYAMTCEPAEACDGTGLSISFVGKRDIAPRDLYVHCCKDDLCNYPAAPGTVSPYIGCMKDILFLVDEASSHHFAGTNHVVANALTFITNLVGDINVGPTAAQVSLATFSRSVHKRFELDTYHTSQDVIHALSQVHPHTSSHGSHGSNGEILDALAYLLHGAMTTRAGDRTNVPDVVVIITDSASVSDYQTLLYTGQLHRLSHDVITIEIGRTNHDNDRGMLATNAANAISVATSQELLPESFKQHILKLICASYFDRMY